jgi:hypothetical protein
MKVFSMRTALLCALVAALSACGGKASFDVGTTVVGVTYPGLVLSYNSSTVSPTVDGRVVFSEHPSYGDSFTIKITSQPQHESCLFPGTTDSTGLSITDTAGRLATINAVVTCSINAHALGGMVKGLTAGTVTLTNGSLGGIATATADTTTPGIDVGYVFASPVTYNDVYGVTVLTQPDTLKCTVANGVGRMGDADITGATGITVTCVPK